MHVKCCILKCAHFQVKNFELKDAPTTCCVEICDHVTAYCIRLNDDSLSENLEKDTDCCIVQSLVNLINICAALTLKMHLYFS